MSMYSNAIVVPMPRAAEPPQPPSDYTNYIIAGFTVIALAFGGLGSWAALAPLDSAVVAPGVLVVESKRKTIQHLEGGIVKRILVRDGDFVEQGAVLAELDQTRAEANLAMVQGQFDLAKAREARLIAERDDLDSISLPDQLAERTADPKVAELVAGQESEFSERRKSMTGQVSILEQRVAQLRTQADGHRRLAESKERQMELMTAELAGLRKLTAKGYYPRNRLLAQEREYAKLEGDRSQELANIAQAEQALGEAELEVLQLKQKLREDVVAELREVQAKLHETAEQLVSAKDVAQRLAITAPVSGFVQGLRIFTEGGVIPPGGELMEIVPNDDRLVIEAQLSPRDIEGVKAGQTAEVRFTALNSRTSPVIEGNVTTLSADRFTDKQTNQAYYLARVEVPKEQQQSLGEHRIQAGMPVELMIKTGERTMMGYLLKPLSDSMARGFNER
jgi:HlyD family type I secretion membrane fusion protein